MRAESLWRRALERSDRAVDRGRLVPLQTERVPIDLEPFVLRRLLSQAPRHLRDNGPRPNPFLPWETDLEVARLGSSHVVLLNKYPVQPGHLLLITSGWQPQNGWLQRLDCQALTTVNQDTSGLWFFNSCGAAGASQPHRHLQLLPRSVDEPLCPLAATYHQALEASTGIGHRLPWLHALSPRRDPGDADELIALIEQHEQILDLGNRRHDPQPRHPYNLLFCDAWLLTVRRIREHWHGFSVNALGFAGYLLATERSQLACLQAEGPWTLLKEVAAMPETPCSHG